MKKILIIKNPAAGSFKKRELERSLEKNLAGVGVSMKVLEVDHSKPLRNQIEDNIHGGYDLVVAAGGDGTVAGVAGVLAGTDMPLGIIPSGTGNLLARELEIPLRTRKAVELLARDYSEKVIDVMCLDDRIFLSNIGVGLSGVTIRNLSRSDKKIWGFMAYIGATLKNLGKVRPQRFTVEADGEIMVIRSPEISISNSGIINRMVIPQSPEIRMDDGALDVCYVKADSIRDYPRLFLNLIRRKPHYTIIRSLQVRNSITVESEKPADVQADGELMGRTPVTVKLLPRALRVIVPSGTDIEN
ncbi:MAG: diacylglycerol kinase family lipid kinase [Candidatus Krumholzibacteriales bacterium]